MDIVFLLGALGAVLLYATFSSARSYFEAGRRRGIEEAVRELVRGASFQLGAEGGAYPPPVEKAISELEKISQHRLSRKAVTRAYHGHLWVIGEAVGESCWMRGHGAGVRRKAPAEGKVRVDLALNELLQLGWLAHLGFQHMMPNYRGFEIYRFSSKSDAEEAARAVGRLEASVPGKARPVEDLTVQYKSRQRLIGDWWDPRDSISA